MSPKRRPLLLPLALLLCAAVFVSIHWLGLGRLISLPGMSGLFGGRTRSAAWSVLEDIRDVQTLETASYVFKTAFPYDFTGGDEVDWVFLKSQYDRAPDMFELKTRPSWHPDGVLPEAWKHAALYARCREAGMDPGRPDGLFVVVEVEMTAGANLETWRNMLLEQDGQQAVQTREHADGRLLLLLPAPPVSISSFSVKDRDTVSEGFPDVPLSPQEWRLLVEDLEPSLRQMARESELLEQADAGARKLLREILTASGYDDVEFL